MARAGRRVVFHLLVRLCSIVVLLEIAHAAKNADPAGSLMAELRRMPKPALDATGKFQTFRKHFVRNDRETGEYTHLIYNCTRPVENLYVDLDSEEFAVANITCTADRIGIETSSVEGMHALHEALLHSSSRLIYVRQGCRSVETGRDEPAFRTFWTSSSWPTNKVEIENGRLETADASPFAFLGEARISFFTNHTEVAAGIRRWNSQWWESSFKGYLSVNLINFNYDYFNDAAENPSIDLFSAGTTKVACENCYLYVGGGIGFELDIDWLDDIEDRKPTYLKLWVQALLTASINLKAEVRVLGKPP
jgi:hypothetical protein